METTRNPTERSDVQSVACLLCSVGGTVERIASALFLNYDAVDWQSKCCCSFLDLEQVVLSVLFQPESGGDLPLS
jgi:hypothetical protein